MRCYRFLPEPTFGFQSGPFWLGAAAIVFIFSFFGFLASRLPLCSPLAMSTPPGFLMFVHCPAVDAGFDRYFASVADRMRLRHQIKFGRWLTRAKEHGRLVVV